MQKIKTISPKQYLDRKGITYQENGKELIIHCQFNGCDKDSKGKEAHLYISSNTGQYECKKCGNRGNLITLAKHLGDSIKDIALDYKNNKPKSSKLSIKQVNTCHNNLPSNIRQYLNSRGISDVIINDYKLGWGKFYTKNWITIPIKDKSGVYQFFKLRQDPDIGNDKMTYPKGIEAQIFDWKIINNNYGNIIICEGELDMLALLSKNIPAITSTHGAGTFKQDWVDKLKNCKKIYICFDNDEAGHKGAMRVADMIYENTDCETFKIDLPEEVGDGGDITDYLTKLNGNIEDLFSKYSRPYPERIDTSQFKPIVLSDIVKTLGLTIKKDETNKIITFLCELSAYTESSQFNISFNAPSSTGKSYIPTEIARLFPEKDIVEIGYCSPTAFFHDVGEYDEERKGYIVDLSRKILIFLDQPHTQLLERLRPLLSHDKKEINIKITDKSQKFGLKTKNVLLRGYPSVIFCTAGLRIDEQEATRFLLLSPETKQEKLREAIQEKIKKESDSAAYKEALNNNPERKLLRNRIMAIKQAKIKEIKIASPDIIEKKVLDNKMLKPRHARDVGRLISLIKANALLNLWFRKKEGSTITASDDDIEKAFKIWDSISESQELNLPPYIYNLYHEVIMPAWKEKNEGRSEGFEEITGELGLSRQDIVQMHYKIHGRFIADWQLRQHIIPMLETAGLIMQERDPSDKRKILIYPTPLLNSANKKNNSESSSGVNNLKI